MAFFGQWVDKGVPDRIAAALSGACVVGGFGALDVAHTCANGVLSAPTEPFVRVSYQEAAERVTADHGSQVGGWVLATGWGCH